MFASLQRLGTLLMFIGSIIYVMYLLEIRILSSQVVDSMSMFIIGCILSYGLKRVEDYFLKALGMNLYLIGTGYEVRSAFIDDENAIRFAHCILGGFHMMFGLFFIYLKRGRPTPSTVNSQLYLAYLICALGVAVITIDIVLGTWTYFRMAPETVFNAWIRIFIGILYLMNWSLLNYIVTKKPKGRAELDVVFFGHHNVFDQIFR